MDPDNEIIALLLDETDDQGLLSPEVNLDSTSRLVRSREGRMRLEKFSSRKELEDTAEITGVFKRGKPILDPETGDVMGYELEEIDHPRTASA